MVTQRCRREGCEGVVMRTSDDVDRHDAAHHFIDLRKAEEAADEARLVAAFERHGFVEIAPGVCVNRWAVG